MNTLNRRTFLALLGSTTASGLLGYPALSRGAYKARVIVVGGGYGGATAAKYLRLADPRVEVLLIEKEKQFVSCALSNEVIAGERDLASLSFGYEPLTAFYGVNVIHDEVTGIDADRRIVETLSGQQYGYDRLIVAPGISFRWQAIEGYDEAAAQLLPHAWDAGEQTLLLRKQLEEMPDGGKVYITAPPNPYKCPPAPYERAALIAHYLQKLGKTRSKIIILDSKDRFDKQALFEQGWEQHYPGMISWVSAANDGKVLRVDAQKRSLYTEFEVHKGDVINVIPPQKAGHIAKHAGLTNDQGWCPVDQQTFESSNRENVHVIGDACIAGAMPKSGYSANSQAKVCAAAVSALIDGAKPPLPSYVNTCYSILAPDYGISVTAVYTLKDRKIIAVEDAGGVSPLNASAWERKKEATYARSWFDNITADIFG
ncbi:MAG: FCSD flavin-binding domain-containing protein [Gammaproteobacteria bacterium]